MAKAATPAGGALPEELQGEIATAGGTRDITKHFVGELEQYADKRIAGDPDWLIYARIAEDDQVFSTFQQRRGAVVSREWDVLPGDEQDPKSVAAADALKNNLTTIGWDRVTDKMLWASFNGYSVAELMWGPLPSGLLGWTKVKVRKARRFRRGLDGSLRLLTRATPKGEIMPDRKFWMVVSGGSDDDEAYGVGLAYWLYWPTLFKRNGVRFWNVFLDKFGTPTAVGKYRPGTPKADQDKLLAALAALATDSGIIAPDSVTIELLQKAVSGTVDFKELVNYMDQAIAKIVLSQTMTTDNGSSRSQAEVHAGVKQEVVKADADLLSDSFNEGPARWFTDLNFGVDVASPKVVRVVEEEADRKVEAETDKSLAETGWKRTEESFKDTYGDGYERAEPIKPNNAQPGVPTNDNVANIDAARQQRVVALAAAEPRPLYVYRRLLNAADLIAWAREQGFTSAMPAQDMHVTVAYSKQPLNWFDVPQIWTDDAAGELTVPAGGARAVDRLGEEGAVVLHFVSRDLVNRWRDIRDAGASWDYASYLPHISFTYQPGDIDLALVEPFRGTLRFGPEIFEPIEDGWHGALQEIALAEPTAVAPRDGVDDAVDEMIGADGFHVASAMTGQLIEQLQAAPDEAAARAILSDALGLMDEGPLASALERAGFAKRLEAEAGA